MSKTVFETSRGGGDAERSLRYPRLLLRRIAEHTGFSYRLSALDLSNDGGELAVQLSRLARTVTVAVDDQASFAAAARTLQEHNARAQLRVSQTGTLATEAARYWLVTIGRPLHKLDGATLLADLESLVEVGGAVAVLGFRFPKLPVNAWRATLGLDAEEPPLDLDEGLLLASTFHKVERVSVFTQVAVTVEHALEKLRPLQPSLTKRDLAQYAEADGQIHALLEGHALIARREADRSGRWS